MGDNTKPIRTRSSFRQDEEMLLILVFIIEPTPFDDALLDTYHLNG